MKAFFWALTGLFFGLWYTERERRIEQTKQREAINFPLQTAVQALAALAAKPSEQPRKDRTLEELSDEYKTRRESLIDYSDDDIAGHLNRICTQLVQPNMTALEAERVGIGLSELVRDAINYDAWKKNRQERRAQKWLDDVGMEIDDDE